MSTSRDNAHKIAVVVNPYSGNGRTARRWPKIGQMLEDLMGDYLFLKTDHPGHATELVRQALRDGYDRIVSVGGDGTHHEVINGFFDGMLPINPRAAMAILPLGTGSDLARTLNMPRGVNAVPHLVSDRVVAADLGRVTFTLPDGGQQYLYFINTCHIGIGGAVVERVNRTTKKYGGRLTYFRGLIMTLLTYKNPFLELDIGGAQVDQKCRDVIIAKGQYDGGGMHVAPNAEIDNGLFDVYVIGDTSRLFAVTHVHKLYQGRLLEHPDKIRFFKTARITARSNETVLINLDGEQPGQLPAAIEVMPKALNIVTACPEHNVATPRRALAPEAPENIESALNEDEGKEPSANDAG
ncbi:MAG: YegS/Rv2252/BmrU family lipid kinase [Nitrospiraceae bacterium]|nr:YegS/Rv2252/BmrU family lipid kinase [Nitrospiraceae bacterium]